MNVILALYPNKRGLGYSVISLPNQLLDYGILTARPTRKTNLHQRIEQFIDFYQPTIVVLRESKLETARSKRIHQLIDDIVEMAERKNTPSFQYSRENIQSVFELHGARNKYEIAQQLIKWIPQLAYLAPKLRKIWMDEDYYMGIFDAVALTYCHHVINENRYASEGINYPL